MLNLKDPITDGSIGGYCLICQAYSEYISIKDGYCFACKSKHYDTLPEIDQQNLKKEYLKLYKI